MYSFSLKSRKYETQTDREKVLDTPRMRTNGNQYGNKNLEDPGQVKTLCSIMLEHNRMPGSFDYNYGQNFYSHNADVDQEAYLVVGPGSSHYAHSHYENGRIMSEKDRRGN